MMVLVSYDISTESNAGRKRLRKIAEKCLDYGRRVQFSVYECDISPGQWEELKYQLVKLYEPEEDSLRFYFLGKNWQKRVEHFGVKKAISPEEVHIL